MTIGMFTDVYKPSINGVTRSIDTFREALESRGHTVYIFAPHVSGEPKEDHVYRLPSIAHLSPKEFPIGVPFLPIVEKTIRPLKLDIVHTHHPFFVGGLGHRASRKLGIPHVHTYHTHLTEYAHYSPIPGIQRYVKFGLKELSKRFCNSADTIIAPSTAIEELLTDYGVTKPIIIDPTGIPLNDFRRLDTKDMEKLFDQYDIPKDKKIILFGGRLAHEKNLLFLLDCYAGLAQKRNDIHLVFAGGGPIEEHLKREIRRQKLEDRATVTGFLKKTEIAKFFGTAYVFAFPSLTETQGIVLSEAMAAGSPVVAVDAMGPKDVITHNEDGFLVPHDKTAFSNALTELLDDTKLHDKFAKAATKNASHFSIEVTTDKLLDVYQSAIKRKSRA